MDFLQQQGIKVEIIPGITSASGIAAELGIPLTHRGVATRFVNTCITCTKVNEARPATRYPCCCSRARDYTSTTNGVCVVKGSCG
ncbi:urophorphyrin methylase 1 [Zea mays]|uniref:Urophorphyrin methylase 1 n=1 Tax=Zea mays TaxID=4577 RepID=A0A1D6G076_MAIZE|nr:urophorphyrin methylase 1 [Zea mays]AQK96895.1 urophorphyrin methylase 1 [Zea mays]